MEPLQIARMTLLSIVALLLAEFAEMVVLFHVFRDNNQDILTRQLNVIANALVMVMMTLATPLFPWKTHRGEPWKLGALLLYAQVFLLNFISFFVIGETRYSHDGRMDNLRASISGLTYAVVDLVLLLLSDVANMAEDAQDGMRGFWRDSSPPPADQNLEMRDSSVQENLEPQVITVLLLGDGTYTWEDLHQGKNAIRCLLCFEDTSPEDAIILDCRHTFCRKCTREWCHNVLVRPERPLEISCPVCRTSWMKVESWGSIKDVANMLIDSM